MSKEMIRLIVVRSLILAAVAVVGFVLVVAPRMGEAARIADEVKAKEAQAALLSAQAADPTEIQTQFIAAQDAAAVLGMRYPAAVETSGLTDAIFVAAQEAGITRTDIQPITPTEPVLGASGQAAAAGGAQPAAEASAAPSPAASGAPASTTPANPNDVKYATTTFDITMLATMDQVARFIKALPLQERAIFVNSVKVQPGLDEGGRATVIVSCTSMLLETIPVPTDNVAAQEADAAANAVNEAVAP